MAARRVVIPYKPRPQQRLIHTGMERHRFGAAVCHRRFGKSVCAVNHLQRAAVLCRLLRPRFGYIAPTYRQGKANVWDYMKYYARPIPGMSVNESELRIDYPNGGQVRIFGADNPDSLRGLYFDGVVLDEYGLHPPNIFAEVITPELSDRNGWALFLGTPNGKNQFYDEVQKAKADPDRFYAQFRASETGILSEKELATARSNMTADQYEQEYECSFEAAVKGAVFARELQLAREEGRITRVVHEPALDVDTDWDIGYDDSTAIWFSQREPGGALRIINYFEDSGQALPFYADIIQEFKRKYHYSYDTHWFPHDMAVTEYGTGQSRLEAANNLGLNPMLTPRLQTDRRSEIEEGIDNARRIFAKCWFDAEKCQKGLEALQHYHFDYNSRIQALTGKPVHDWASHAADAFRGLATRYFKPKGNKVKPDGPDYDPADRRFYPKVRGRGGY